MEIDGTPPALARKICNLATILFHILKKGVSKNKLLTDLHSFIKPWKTAGKSMRQILHHLHKDYSTLICNSTVDVRMSAVIHRRDYEFSCSNSPAYYHSSIFKRKNQHLRQCRRYRKEDIDFVQKVFDVLNKCDVVVGEATGETASPLASLPGFGNSPIVRQLRVTDSPFPVKDTEENPQVDKDAEDFIKKFYKDLNIQGRFAALECSSPTPCSTWER